MSARSGGGPAPLAVITLCSTSRVLHVRNQLAALAGRQDVVRVVVWLGEDEPADLDADVLVRVPPGAAGLRLAAARNAGADAARAAGAALLVFLDADCIPGPRLLQRYREAWARHPSAVLCGPVTYLPPGADVATSDALVARTAPHPARPNPADDQERPGTPSEYPLFWSLSFALAPAVWDDAGGFDEAYEGYGGEDTDFAFRLRAKRIPLVWVGGAHAYHQYHETSSPPWQHLDDILRNGALFARRWGEWPMLGWLRDFEAAGAAIRRDDGWHRT